MKARTAFGYLTEQWICPECVLLNGKPIMNLCLRVWRKKNEYFIDNCPDCGSQLVRTNTIKDSEFFNRKTMVLY